MENRIVLQPSLIRIRSNVPPLVPGRYVIREIDSETVSLFIDDHVCSFCNGSMFDLSENQTFENKATLTLELIQKFD